MVDPAPVTASPAVIGRDAELARIARFLDRTATAPAGLLLAGEPGIGKTTLWRAAIDEARRRGRTVLVARPSHGETQLAFAALADLLDRAEADALDGLPDPQRRALEAAIGRADAEATVDPLAIGQAVLRVVRVLAATSPVLVALDDPQYLDAPTARVLEYVLRRLESEPVGVIATIPADSWTTPGPTRAMGDARVERLNVGPLTVESIARLIAERSGTMPRRTIAVRIREISGGNPFYALELARTTDISDAPAGDDARAGVTVLPGSLRELVRDRIAELEPDALAAALVVAASVQPTREVVAAAIGDREVAEAGLRDALGAGILEERDGGRLAFSHPLLAWATYATVAKSRRLEVHRRLALAAADPDERVRHLALATRVPDAAVAAALDDAGVRARGGGAPETAAELAAEARRLTPPDDADAGRRRTRVQAEYLVQAGDPVQARSLLEPMIDSMPRGPARAAAMSLLADIRSGDDWDAKVEILHEALPESEPDSAIRAEIEVALGVAGWNLVQDLPGAIEHARRALVIAERVGDLAQQLRANASLAFVEAFAGDLGTAIDRLDRAVALESGVDGVRVLFQPTYTRGLVLEWADRFEESRTQWVEVGERVERLGDSDSRPLAHLSLAGSLIRLGRLAEAERELTEGETAAELQGHAGTIAIAKSYGAWLHALRGEVDEARRSAGASMALAAATKSHVIEGYSRINLALAELSVGDAAAALVAIRPSAERLAAAGVRHTPALAAVPFAAEAAALSGQLEDADRWLGALEDYGRRTGHITTLRAFEMVRALRLAGGGDLDGAAEAARAAVEHAGRIDDPFGRARAWLVQGEVLRRLRRRTPAREALGRALEAFESMGAAVWAERARSELGRTGVRAGGQDALTTTEREVASLVAAGRTNREVAAALFMSPHTVEAHLTSIYQALGIRGRTDLARVFASETALSPSPAPASEAPQQGGSGISRGDGRT